MAAETLKLDIENMHCASCVGRVEKALAQIAGVVSVNVNLATETAIVRFSGGSIATQALDVLGQAGYPARPQASAAPRDSRDDSTRLARHTAIAAVLTLPVFILEMGSHLSPAFHALIAQNLGHTLSWSIQFLLTSLVLFWPGRIFLSRGIPGLMRGAPDMNALVAVGTLAAWGYSTLALFAPSMLPESARVVYFEAAALIVTLILLGRWLESRARGRTGQAIRALIGLQPKTARVERDGALLDLAIDQINPGDHIHIRPGERVAVDGVVTRGSSYVDEAMITGEPMPTAKTEGQTLTGGTLNGNGALVMQARAVGEDTVLAQIIAMVEQAQGAKLPIQDLVNRITAWFVPAILGIAVVTAAVWLAVGPEPRVSHALVAAVAVLIIACPCAMGLATPTSIMVGTGRAAELGVLFRKGDALQGLQNVELVAFDKTGTLTQGRPELTDAIPFGPWKKRDIVLYAASLEASSGHPIAQALTQAATQQGLNLLPVAGFVSETGRGLRGQIDGKAVLIGTPSFLEEQGIAFAAQDTQVDQLAQSGKTAFLLAIDGVLAAVLAVSDQIKPEAADAVRRLKAMGLGVAMITGDRDVAAQAIAAEIGIETVIAEVLPKGKSDAIAQLQAGGQKVAFVGDGMNDAPALATADIGIAIGTGTDVAIETADVVLMSGDLGGCVNALALSRITMRNIGQNLIWAFGYNILLIPVAAGLFYPMTGLLLSPALAAAAMALSSVFVLSNALRLRWVQPA